MQRETLPTYPVVLTEQELEQAFESLVESAARLGWTVALVPKLDECGIVLPEPQAQEGGVPCRGIVIGSEVWADAIEMALRIGLPLSEPAGSTH